MRTRSLLTGAVLALVLTATGCSDGAPAPAVSKDAAECAQVRPVIMESIDIVTTAMQSIGTDDAAAKTGLNDAVTKAQEAADKVGDSDVAHTVRTFTQGITEYRDAVTGLIDHPEVASDEAFNSLTTTFLGTADGFMTMCPAGDTTVK